MAKPTAKNALARMAQGGTPAEKARVKEKVAGRYPSIMQYNQRNRDGSVRTVTRRK